MSHAITNLCLNNSIHYVPRSGQCTLKNRKGQKSKKNSE